MKAYEIIFLVPNLLKSLHEIGIKCEDYRWIDLYKDYLALKNTNNKTSYIIAVLSDRYHVCERKVYKVIKMLEQDCPNGAVG